MPRFSILFLFLTFLAVLALLVVALVPVLVVLRVLLATGWRCRREEWNASALTYSLSDYARRAFY